jgi:prepilin-type N-terminal cleavage/methylation domain-containing protein
MMQLYPTRLRCGGFTLIEVLVSLSVMSILMLGISAAMGLALRAVPDEDSAMVRITDAGSVLDQVINDLRYARHITERSATAVRVVVADRDGDGAPQTIRYAWSGTPGDPLTRTDGIGAAVAILANVHDFTLSYDLRSQNETYPGPNVESAETVLASVSNVQNNHLSKIINTDWIGQYFRPVLPADAISWKVNRVLFRARASQPASSSSVELRTADADMLPSFTILAQQTMTDLDLTNSVEWREFLFNNVTGLSPGQGLCLVIRHTVGAESASIQYDDLTGPGLLKSTNTGKSWLYENSRRLYYYVYGTVTTPGPDQSVTRRYVTDTNVTLQVGGDAAARLDTAVQMLNEPEALAAVWELDFNADPTTVDLNADGGDWLVDNAAQFNQVSLGNGTWQALQVVATVPTHRFDTTTTVDVRMRSIMPGGRGATLWLDANWDSSTYAFFAFFLTRHNDDTQTLAVQYPGAAGAWATPLAFHNLPGDFVDVQLIVDAAGDTFHLKIDGVGYGTYAFSHFASPNGSGTALLRSWTVSGEFDHVLIRVAEAGL